MLRLSVALVAVLALVGTTDFAVSSALAASGAAYDKCMAKCMKNSPKGNVCPGWCSTH